MMSGKGFFPLTCAPFSGTPEHLRFSNVPRKTQDNDNAEKPKKTAGCLWIFRVGDSGWIVMDPMIQVNHNA